MGAGALGAVGGWLRWLAVAVLAVLMVAMLPAAAGTASPADGGSVPVIVQAEPGALTMAAREVGRLGGRVGRQLRVVNGFSAVLPGLAMGRLAGSPGAGR